MNDDIGISKSRVFLSFVAGGVTGAAVALLLAPHSGAGTRRLIQQRIQEGADRGRKAGQRIAGKGRDALDAASRYLGTMDTEGPPVRSTSVARSGPLDGEPRL